MADPRRLTYEPLRHYLRGTTRDTVTLSFAEIAAILGMPLPGAAPAWSWWTKPTSPMRARTWLAVGWRVQYVDTYREMVTFVRVEADD